MIIHLGSIWMRHTPGKLPSYPDFCTTSEVIALTNYHVVDKIMLGDNTEAEFRDGPPAPRAWTRDEFLRNFTPWERDTIGWYTPCARKEYL